MKIPPYEQTTKRKDMKMKSILFIAIVIIAISVWATLFGRIMNKAIKEREYTDSLKREKLELEIEILKKKTVTP